DLKYRTAQKGGMRTVYLKAWWPKGQLRPDEDTVYVVELRYRDVAKAPVIFHGYGGLGRYHAPTELHRFGGTGDGAWKTACLSAGWDQLMRLQERPEVTAVGFEAEADLPIASLRLRPATQADQARHNAETRAWIAAVQAKQRQKANLGIEPRKFLPGKDLGPIVAFPTPAMLPLMPNGQPRDEQVGAAVKVRMCLNEMEGGSFGVYANGAALTNVRYTVSDLSGPGGKLVADVIPRTAEYAVISGGKVFPQRLWPAYAVDIPAGQSHWFIVNLRTHRGKTKPGLYKGRIAIAADQGSASLPLEVRVLNVDLLTMGEAGLFMGGCVTGLVPAHDIQFQADYNQNGINLWFSGIRPGMTMVDGKLVLDYTILDEWMAAARKRGLVGNVWFLGGNPYSYPYTMTIFREMGKIDNRGGATPMTTEEWGRLQSAPANRDKPMKRQRELMVEWCRQVTTHAKANNWPELILTPFDEPAKWIQSRVEGNSPGQIGTGEWIMPYFKDACAAIREGAPGTRIYGSIHHINYRGRNSGLRFLPDIDVFCTNAIHEDPKIGDKVRAAKKDFWQYSGTGAGDSPDRARFTFGFFFAAFGSRGSLAWAYNWGRGYDTTSGSNWMYAWQTPYDTIPAPYFEGMREAWDDRRVIETYTKRFAGDAEAMAELKTILAAAAASRARGGRDTVSDFWAAADDATKMDRWRDQLLARLAK
ncbi:MAG TPA: hypothetical protein VFJ30_07270, partial [Phycisphaerae bacterium]|nr:hypothetical protein [Phycisphaerae bacterium]